MIIYKVSHYVSQGPGDVVSNVEYFEDLNDAQAAADQDAYFAAVDPVELKEGQSSARIDQGVLNAYHTLLRHGMYELRAGRKYPAFVTQAARFLEATYPHIAEVIENDKL